MKIVDELFKSTKKSFRNLIHENQREAVEEVFGIKLKVEVRMTIFIIH